MAEENKQYENLPEFLNEFSGALQKLYPNTPENQDENGNWKYEQIYPVGNEDHEGFADLIAPEKYAELTPENIVNGVTIFGKTGSATLGLPEVTVNSTKNPGFIQVECGEIKSSEKFVMGIFYDNLTESDDSTISIQNSILCGKTILGYEGKSLGLPTCKVHITDKSNVTWNEKHLVFPQKTWRITPSSTADKEFTTYVGSYIEVSTRFGSVTAEYSINNTRSSAVVIKNETSYYVFVPPYEKQYTDLYIYIGN